MNVQKLVTSAIFKAGLQDREHQPMVNAGYQDTALDFMNNILDEWRDNIPYANQVRFNDIDNLTATSFVEVDTVQYVIPNEVPFLLKESTLTEFKQAQAIIDLKAFPSRYYFDQLSQTIEIYPLPSQTAYYFLVKGRIGQIDLGIYDDIPANMPRFMQDALIHECAYRLACEYGRKWSPEKEERRQGLLKTLLTKKEIDLSPDRNLVFGLPGVQDSAPFPIWFYISGGGLGG